MCGLRTQQIQVHITKDIQCNGNVNPENLLQLESSFLQMPSLGWVTLRSQNSKLLRQQNHTNPVGDSFFETSSQTRWYCTIVIKRVM